MNKIQSQRGGVLVASLVILLVMSFMGIASMRNMSLEEKMAGNSRSRDLAFQAAELGLRAAENDLNGIADISALPSFGCEDAYGKYQAKCFGDPQGTLGAGEALQDADWSDPAKAAQCTVGTCGEVGEVARLPAYVVEQMQNQALDCPYCAGEQEPIRLVTFRITSRGYGSGTDAVAVVQSTFNKLFNPE
jgi:type IV pilus assembly protein PilX